MITMTRTPRLLVKLAKAPKQKQASFNVANQALDVSFKPLFANIGPTNTHLSAAPTNSQWYIMASNRVGAEVNAWDLCHHLVKQGFGITGLDAAEFAEPDLEQQWLAGTPVAHALAATLSCDSPKAQNPQLPIIPDNNWFRDAGHSQLEAARTIVGQPANRVRIAHFDTGYDPNHITLPQFLRRDLQKNFIDDEQPGDATDHTSGILTNLGHGAGTLSILAGATVDGVPLGGAPFLDVVPIRVANSVVLFRNSAIAQAFDYVYGLFAAPTTRVHVITMSMGGLASQAWAEAVNRLYELGVFIVTAAGNNFGNLPTRNIVYPARFKRVVAACGVMADGRPYADLPIQIMAGNYGPASKMATALAGFTPNTPWARLGCRATVDHDGQGTSAATPQIAAAAALWIQKYRSQWEAYPQGWMRVEAVRRALFDTAKLAREELRERLGRGALQADAALAQQPAAAASLQAQAADSASFPILRVLTGLGLAAVPDLRQRMLELEALQIAQRSHELEQLLPDPENPGELARADRQRIIELLHDAPGASQALRATLAPQVAPTVKATVTAPQPNKRASVAETARLKLAMEPPLSLPSVRKLRVFAFDPLLAYNPDLLPINLTTLDVHWEDLQPGPVGKYLEVIDVDPATGCCYAPVDLNHPTALAQAGLSPSESDPRFHQQMVYAVAMKTISHFERALGRVALWAPRFYKYEHNGEPRIERQFVQRLRIYPHALREANAYYSREKKALLFGYFPASSTEPGANLPGGTVFCCLSHDIVAHETTHALLDGLHRYFGEPTNTDVLAFHEAFADIVALFQHFTVPEALRDQIARTRGDLAKQNLLGELALQFGQGIGQYGALRSAIGKVDEDTKEWRPALPTPQDYQNATEAHKRGAVLVAAVFDAFLNIYRRRSADLIRLATGGTGILPDGNIPVDLVNRLAQEASKVAGHVLNICIRALDYCPPVDLYYGEYLRALITADRDLVPEDVWGYRAAFIQGFHRRGIYPENVRNLSSDSLCWERPEVSQSLEGILPKLQLDWDLRIDRRRADEISLDNALAVHRWITAEIEDAALEALGLHPGGERSWEVNGKPGKLRPFEVHSVRPARRIGPDGQQRTDLVVVITQTWLPDDGNGKYRGGCTLIIDLEARAIRYMIRKRVGLPTRVQTQEGYRSQQLQNHLGVNYFGESVLTREPFAIMHRGL